MSRPTPTRQATLVVDQRQGDAPFHGGVGELPLPWRQLRERFATEGVRLDTRDVAAGRPVEVEFELHLDAQPQIPHPLSYAFLHEDPSVRPGNADLVELARYRMLFTSDERLIDDEHALRLAPPSNLAPRAVPGFRERDLLCVMIAANPLSPPAPDLHARRVETIRFLEAQAPDRFALFGPGWDRLAARSGALGRLQAWTRPLRGEAAPPFPSWRGPTERRHAVLERARFCLCCEDSRDRPGHAARMIFDCLASGCVPVLLGADGSTPPVPEDCFIDGDAFPGLAQMLASIAHVDAGHFAMHQQCMREFLASPDAQPFGIAHWCDTLVTRILADVAAA